MDFAVYNPQGKKIEELPVIYGFNNGGSPGFFIGQLIAEDGTALGSHLCTNEGYMLHDLGILAGSREDRHDGFRKHYPDGYRMEFVCHEQVPSHAALNRAFKLNKEQAIANDHP